MFRLYIVAVRAPGRALRSCVQTGQLGCEGLGLAGVQVQVAVWNRRNSTWVYVRGCRRGCGPSSKVSLGLSGMVLVTESVRPGGLDFLNQRKVVVLRDVHGLSFPDIAAQVKNLRGKRPTPRTCRNYYAAFSTSAGRKKSKYSSCGRQAWKLTAESRAFLLKTLKHLRQKGVCTCATLRAALAREKGVTVDESTIRKFLVSKGYKWLPRAQKRKYSPKQMQERAEFARKVVALGPACLRRKLAFSMDGCVLPIPPRDVTDRINFLRHLQPRLWRLRSERLSPDLAGHDCFSKQTALERAVPLWGGIGPGGFATVLLHQKKKLTVAEWLTALQGGKLLAAVRKSSPDKPEGPWHILCDNEKFLHAAAAREEYRKQNLRMWKIPPKSPDLNPIERFWSYLKARLRALDLKDALRKRPALGKTAYKARVKRVLQAKCTQTAAKNIVKGYMKTCKDIVRSRGAASTG